MNGSESSKSAKALTDLSDTRLQAVKISTSAATACHRSPPANCGASQPPAEKSKQQNQEGEHARKESRRHRHFCVVVEIQKRPKSDEQQDCRPEAKNLFTSCRFFVDCDGEGPAVPISGACSGCFSGYAALSHLPNIRVDAPVFPGQTIRGVQPSFSTRPLLRRRGGV